MVDEEEEPHSRYTWYEHNLPVKWINLEIFEIYSKAEGRLGCIYQGYYYIDRYNIKYIHTYIYINIYTYVYQ